MPPRLPPLPLGSSSLADVRDLVSPFVVPSARWGLLQSVDDGGPVSTLARWVEQTVLHETYDVRPEDVAAELAAYDAASVWHLLIHHPTGSAVGAVRCLVGDAASFQFTSDLRESWDLTWLEACRRVGLDPGADFVEGCSFSVLPEWRTADNLWPIKLVAAAYMHLVEDLGASAAVQIINPVVRRAFARYGIPFLSVDAAVSFPGWGDALWDPTVSITTPDNEWFATSDEEFHRLFRDRDTSVRGGTTLPSKAARRAVVRRHRELRDRVVIDLRSEATAEQVSRRRR